MCGIAGVVASRVRPEHTGAVQSMMASIRHRGPDGQGIEKDESFVFGHQRLAIIDIEGGRQPMVSEDGRFALVYNGEIYNYLELRQELIRGGQRFQTFSDTEVLLKLLALEGKAALSKLNGMFAFAFFDRKEKRFFAARDHFGIKPFYYTLTPQGDLYFASEIKALFAGGALKPQSNPEALQEYLTFQFCLGKHTLFKGVQRLEPATCLEWTLGEAAPRVSSYWDLSFNAAASSEANESYYTDKLLGLLEDSVRLQLRSDVPVGTYLSGGIDSSLVTLLAARNLSDKVSVFCGRFAEGAAYDESEYARLVAEQCQARYFDIVPTAADFVSLMPKLIYHMDEPVAGPGLFPQYIVSREAARNVKVALGGQGGDEIFCGYARYVVASLEQALKADIVGLSPNEKVDVDLAGMLPHLSLLKAYQPMLQGFWREGLFGRQSERYYRLVDRSHDLGELLNPELLKQRSGERLFAGYRQIFEKPQTESFTNRMQYFDLKTLLPALLQVEDRVSMAVSLESRVPLLDYRIVECVAAMPASIRFRGGQTKYALKQTIRNIVPEKILNRSDKMGFPVPLREWSKSGIVREFLGDQLLSRRSRERGLFQPAVLERLIDGEQNFGRQVWGALCLELWHQQFMDGPAG